MRLLERLGLKKRREESLVNNGPPPLPPCPFIPRRVAYAPTQDERGGLKIFSTTGYVALQQGMGYTNEQIEKFRREITDFIIAHDQPLRERVGRLELTKNGRAYKDAKKQGANFPIEIDVIGSLMAFAADSSLDDSQLTDTFRALENSLLNLEQHQQQLQAAQAETAKYQAEAKKAWDDARIARDEALILRKKDKRHNRKMFFAELGIIGLLGVTAAVVITYNARYHTSNALANKAITEIGQLRTQLSQQQEYLKSYSLASTTAFTNEINTRVEEDSKLRTLLAGVNSRNETTAQKVDSLGYAVHLASMLYSQVLKLQQDSQESRENQEALTRNMCSLEEQFGQLRRDNAGIITDIAELRRSGATQLELESYKLEVAGRFQREVYPRMQGLDDRVIRLETNQIQQQGLYDKLLLQNTSSIPPGKDVEQQIKEAARIKLK